MSQSMPVCNNLEDLYESALLLIGNAPKLRDWCNGDENTNVTLGGKSVPSLRKLIANINRVAGIATLQNIGGVRPDGVTIGIDDLGVISVIAAALRQAGGGLNVDASGKLYVDFSQMPTDKFEALLKSLRLPIWLNGNINFYVDQNHASASDSLVTGRGLSASLPFKTIQACAKYVANNYNLAGYIVYINVNSGTYEERLSLPDFNANGGLIWLKRYSGVSRADVVIKDTGAADQISVSGGLWRIEGLTIKKIVNLSSLTGSSYIYPISSSAGTLQIYTCDIQLELSGSLGSEIYAYINMLTTSGTGIIAMRPFSSENTRMAVPAAISNVFVTGLHVNNGGSFSLYNGNSGTNGNFQVSGAFSAFASVSRGAINVGSGQPVRFAFSSGSPAPSGKRYSITNGGSIATGNRGADYFPGSVAGTADASTYSWYK